MTSYYFAIVGTSDNPLYETEFGTSIKSAKDGATKKDESRHLNQFIVHSSLDIVEELQWNLNTTHLKTVDKFNDYLISAFITPGGIKFVLLHDSKSDDGIRSFFNDCFELYIKTLMNPFYEVNSPITSPIFDSKVRQLAKRYLG
ncbi:uncharacterized protein VTP21DRAFT_1862 [Calcarisporiella thermophila]|uniref:uncharacterized protein n=1 Tax=Calcarisporiella thermophila TaxID=911321 RepID=UPI0037444C90